jgi:SPP1 family predicted phage head-tail adaptor
MDPGEMNKRVTIQAPSTDQPTDDAGQLIEDAHYTDLDTVWAKITTATGRELYHGQQVQAELSHKVTIRHYEGLTTAHRLKYGTRIFDINYVINVDEGDVHDELLCKEVVV